MYIKLFSKTGLFLLLLFCYFPVFAQSDGIGKLPDIIKKENGNYQFIVDGKPFLVLGAQLWNSSAWPYILDKELPQLKNLHCNTLEAPVYWQVIEPHRDKFDFSNVDSLILGARKVGLRLILLWFGSYKNGASQYAPIWMLRNPGKYRRMQNSCGKELQILSTLCPANLEADKRAFSKLMKHVKQIDSSKHTVIMVQVENEPGSLGTDRDYSDSANIEFKKRFQMI